MRPLGHVKASMTRTGATGVTLARQPRKIEVISFNAKWRLEIRVCSDGSLVLRRRQMMHDEAASPQLMHDSKEISQHPQL